ncbi:Peroxidase [Handroanthus impetiginosus]|uniref:peroxidase n=1 Tax=Handroanthus impetiginosus TaxID=429701 RepID=A0A2G9GST6_9LAMI|nr:Peroxidase [Handroanthus impetiginosus]
MAIIVNLLVIFGAISLIMGNSSSCELSTDYYKKTCPPVFKAIKSVVKSAVRKEKRMGASLLRLHFHDCFVQVNSSYLHKGCDGSILLDDTSSFIGEKTAGPNNNSVRGYEVIDDIKSKVESMCPGIVSCADIVAIAARHSIVLLGGPKWKVKVGRRDSKTANLSAANGQLPSPFSTLDVLIERFRAKGLSASDMVALSGA